MDKEPKFKVLGARCLVLEDKQEETLKSGLIIPGRDKEPQYSGRVLRVGEGAMLDDGTLVQMRVSVGDRVVYQHFTGSPISLDGDIYVILNERDVLGIIEN